MNRENNDYFAFISYARHDSECAQGIQRFLEHYRFPQNIVMQENRPVNQKYLRPVFLDIYDLTTCSPTFTGELEDKLKKSRYLIVLCSPHSARIDSVCHWEIKTFLKYHSMDAILPVAIDGVSEANIPEELIPIYKKRNIVSIDSGRRIRDFGNRERMFHIIEFLLKVDAANLYNRYNFEKRRWMMINISVVIIILSVITLLSLFLSFKSHEAAAESRKAAIASREVALQEKQRVKFEKKVFPYSLVVGYAKNFVIPLLSNAKADKCVLVIAMPENYSELDNAERLKLKRVAADAHLLDWKMRGTNIAVKNRRNIAMKEFYHLSQIKDTVIYADAASTVTAIKSVVDYLTTDNPYYSPEEKNKLAMDYVDEFKECLLKILKENLSPEILAKQEIHFVGNATELRNVLKKFEQKGIADEKSR